MRRILPLLAVLVAASAALGAAYTFWRPAPAPVATAVLTEPAAPPVPVAPPMVAEAAPPPPARAPDLPVLEVQPRGYHMVPEDDGSVPVPHITLQTRDGKPVVHSAALAPKAAAIEQRSLRVPTALGGVARATGAAALSVEGHAVQLFGVRPPESRDRCAAHDGSSQPCGEASRAALAARLAGNGKVNCSMPGGQDGDPAFVCRDSSGLDLGELLISQGFALADTKRSYNYLGAENAARSAKRGLWHYR